MSALLALLFLGILELIVALALWAWSRQLTHDRLDMSRLTKDRLGLASIIIINTDGIIVQVNHEVARMFGYEPSELIGQKVNILMTDQDKHDHDSYLKRYQETGQPHIIGKGRMIYARKRDGTVFPAELTVSETKGLDGATKYYFGHVRDISHEKWAEAVGLTLF